MRAARGIRQETITLLDFMRIVTFLISHLLDTWAECGLPMVTLVKVSTNWIKT